MNKNKIWFKRKTYGWGWTPSSWEGWVVLALWFLVFTFSMVRMNDHEGFKNIIFIFFSVGVLIYICYKKGEKPRWQWGSDSDAVDKVCQDQKCEICQSCGFPMKNIADFGTNSDDSQNMEYCRFCYQGGNFTNDMTLPEFIDKQVNIAKEKLGMSEDMARKMANEALPNLKRWKR